MNLIFLDELFSMSGYQKRHSVQAWLAGMNIPLLKIGKNYAVDKNVFERQFSKRYKITKQQTGYQPTQKTEKAFLAELDHLLSENSTLQCPTK